MIKENDILEHVILKALLKLTFTEVAEYKRKDGKHIPIYKRNYNSASLHFGTLLKCINEPAFYDEVLKDKLKLEQLRGESYSSEDIMISKFGWIEFSNAIELLAYNKHIIDNMPNYLYSEYDPIRTVTLTEVGAMAYYSKFYVQEYKKSLSENLEDEKLLLEVENMRNDLFDYPTVRQHSRIGFYISIGTIIISLLALLVSIFKK